jgi:hypothetical protein
MTDLAKAIGCIALLAATMGAIGITSALGTFWLIGWLQ